MAVVYVLIVLALVVLVGVAFSVRILKQYERAVLFRLGRVNGGARGPGPIVFVPGVDRLHRVSLRTGTMPIQSQGIITRDNVSVDVSAVAYYRVADVVRSVVAIENVSAAINQIARPPCVRSLDATRWTRRCPRPTRSTRTSARSSTSRPRSGGCKSP